MYPFSSYKRTRTHKHIQFQFYIIKIRLKLKQKKYNISNYVRTEGIPRLAIKSKILKILHRIGSTAVVAIKSKRVVRNVHSILKQTSKSPQEAMLVLQVESFKIGIEVIRRWKEINFHSSFSGVHLLTQGQVDSPQPLKIQSTSPQVLAEHTLNIVPSSLSSKRQISKSLYGFHPGNALRGCTPFENKVTISCL